MPFNTKAAQRLRRYGAVAVVSVVGPVVPAMALTPQVEAEVRYQLECFALIFKDPAAHVEQCNPQLQTGYVPVTSTGPTAPAPPEEPKVETPPPPPPPPDGCPEGSYPDNCGGCYEYNPA